MPGENVYDWSVVAVDNGTSDALINWQEGQARATVNNSARSMLAAVAKFRNLITGVITTGGTAAAQTFVSGVSYTAIPNGLRVMLRVGITNTAGTTLNMDGIGDVAIKSQRNENLVGGEMLLGTFAELIYSSAVSAWVLITSVAAAVRTDTIPVDPGGGGTGTYTPPAGVKYLEIEMVGGGAGGGGGGGPPSPGGTGTPGTATCWSLTNPATATPMFSAGGGSLGLAGGVVSGSATPQFSFSGSPGAEGVAATVTDQSGIGGNGGSSFFGGGGVGMNAKAGSHAVAKTGSGGGGGGVVVGNNYSAGTGGASGAYLRAVITTPASAYYYTVGLGGAGGGSGSGGNAGGSGAGGIVIIHEFY